MGMARSRAARAPLESQGLHLVQPWDCEQLPSSCSQHLQVCLTAPVRFCFCLMTDKGLSSRANSGGLDMGYFWYDFNPRISE